jgi:hypothetical protein
MNDQVQPRAGTFSDWNINVAGVQGQQGATGGPGPTGPQGNAGPIGPGYAAGSSTSLPIATGSITITTQVGLAYTPGARVRLASNGTPTAWMEGTVTSYSGSTMVINIDTIAAAAAPVVFPQLPGYIGGLTLSNDATSPNTVIDIALGAATSDDYSTLMLISTAMTKNCNAAWAVGNGNGALDVGTALAASTWYHVFLIERIDNFTVDILISTSTNPTLPANYTKRRRIGSIKTDASSHIFPFLQYGDQFLWITTTWDICTNIALAQNAWTTLTCWSPPGVRTTVQFFASLTITASGAFVMFRSPDQLGVPFAFPALSNAPTQACGQFAIGTNLNSQIQAGTNAALITGGFYASTYGYIDNRGK